MKYLLCCLAVLLTACGGGGSSTSTTVPTQVINNTPPNKLSLAWVDYRFDDSSLNINGVTTTSYAGMTPMVDHIKKVGYNTIVFQTEVPVNTDTGQLDLNAVPAQPRTLPKDFWRVVDYAKSQGLVVWIMIAITDGLDNGLTSTSVGVNFNAATMFDTITTYDKSVAVLAQQHNVNGIYLGDLQVGFDQAPYLLYWQTLFSSIKNVFNGKLSYMASYDTPVYDLVDYISTGFNFPLMSTTTTNVTDIVNSYYHDTNGLDIVNYVQTLSKSHNNKPLILDYFRASPTDTGVGLNVDLWNLIFNGGNFSSIPPPNYNLLVAKISAFCNISSVITPVAGIGFDEYIPWAQAAWVQNAVPGSANYNWYLFDTLGFELYNHTQAETAINQCVGNFK